jgi:glycosyltransferase involved in cell wall biosynthesis/ribosomal protein S18 acetylase RimI-like enzyme
MPDRLRVAHVTTVDVTLWTLLRNQLTHLREQGFEVTGISAPGPWVAELEAAGIRHLPWPHATRSWNPWGDLRAFLELLAILRRERFDIVHTHNPKPGVLGRAAGRIARVGSVVNTVHGLYATPSDRLTKRAPVVAMEWLAARCSDLELYQSEEDLAWARRIGLVRQGRSEHLGNGIDLAQFDPQVVDPERVVELRRTLGIGERTLVVGTVGRLVAEKGFRELVSAAEAIRAERGDVRFLAVGQPDPEKADAIDSRELEAASASVQVTGWSDQVRELLAVMDVFVLPSWREGLPRSAIEAAAMAKPLVLTNIRGCREVARDGVEGLLVPPRDPVALGAAIRLLLDDPAMRARLGAAARARAVERFDERRVGALVVACYRRLLGEAGAGESPRQVEIRPARLADVPTLARLHRQSLPEAFLPTLGDRFLRQLYRSLLADAEGITLVAEDHRGVIGFASGVVSVRNFYRRFYRRHGIRAALAAAPRLIRPSVLRRVVETARYPSGTTSLPDAELLAIAVDAKVRARSVSVGVVLARGVLQRLAESGADQVKVVTSSENQQANRFYGSLGFDRLSEVFVHEGTSSNVWVMACRS